MMDRQGQEDAAQDPVAPGPLPDAIPPGGSHPVVPPEKKDDDLGIRARKHKLLKNIVDLVFDLLEHIVSWSGWIARIAIDMLVVVLWLKLVATENSLVSRWFESQSLLWDVKGLRLAFTLATGVGALNMLLRDIWQELRRSWGIKPEDEQDGGAGGDDRP